VQLPVLSRTALRALLTGVVGLTAMFLGAPRLAAFPPAPFYIVYGMVRDQVGATLRVDGAEISLLRDGTEIGRSPIQTDLRADSNYEIQIRIDRNPASARIYSNKAVAAQGVFSLVVVMNGQNFYPIEASGTLRAGNGGERVRLDLNLGIDANNDGLPDAWQEWQLYQAGRRPGQPGWDINLITKHGDFDGDGISNYQEYVAGTFAGDATERFELRLLTKTATLVGFEFFAITGKVYSIEQSADLRTWTTAPLTTTPTGTFSDFYRATAVGVMPAYVAASADSARFFRLTVR
jgi:hypothetical protein